jgi:hypothetical protein
MSRIKGKVISLKFSKKFFDNYKNDCEGNEGKKLSNEEVVKIMNEDLLGMYEKIEDYYSK